MSAKGRGRSSSKARPPATKASPASEPAPPSAPQQDDPDLFDRRAFESEDPWVALYVPPPDKDTSFPVGVRLSASERRKIETVLASMRTPWNTTSDALRWCVFVGMQRMSQILGDTSFAHHLRLTKVESAMRAIDKKRVFLSELTSACYEQIKHLLVTGELEEARAIYERVIKLVEECPRGDTMSQNLLSALLDNPDLEVVRKACNWDGGDKGRVS